MIGILDPLKNIQLFLQKSIFIAKSKDYQNQPLLKYQAQILYLARYIITYSKDNKCTRTAFRSVLNTFYHFQKLQWMYWL